MLHRPAAKKIRDPLPIWEGIFYVLFASCLRPLHDRFTNGFCDIVKVDQGNLILNFTEVKIMVEVERDFASKGVAGAGLGLGK